MSGIDHGTIKRVQQALGALEPPLSVGGPARDQWLEAITAINALVEESQQLALDVQSLIDARGALEEEVALLRRANGRLVQSNLQLQSQLGPQRPRLPKREETG